VGVIYVAINETNGKTYIGKSKHGLDVRKEGHQRAALSGSHLLFHRALRKYGFALFRWMVLRKDIPEDQLDVLEKQLIEEWDTRSPEGYNLTSGGEGGDCFKGCCHSEETKQIQRERRLGTKHSAETKAKIAAWNKGRVHLPRSEATRKKMSVAQRGHRHSEETKVKMSETRKRLKLIPFKGQHHSEETKAKISIKSKRKRHPLSDEHKAAISASRLGQTLSEETRAKLSESHKGKKQSPETIAKRIETRKERRKNQAKAEPLATCVNGL